MKSVIEEIYYNVEGNFKEDKEYWEINKNYGELFDKLSEKLTDEQKFTTQVAEWKRRSVVRILEKALNGVCLLPPKCSENNCAV